MAAFAFLLGALSLIGLPPFSGFWAKVGLLSASVDAGQYVVLAVALVVSLGTLVSMLKLGSGIFWGAPMGMREEEDEETPSDITIGQQTVGATGVALDVAAATEAPPVTKWRPLLVIPGLALALLSLAIGLSPEWLLALTQTAGESLADPVTYVTSVLGGGSA